ncbi:hypothetical protein K456DRAFT_1755042 [Colletotrichum gloeosporioides 23]|nr:hypothetical protein K456DRAFT_1755042 [Colletotrichum gloeosporioides 23]
MQEARHHASRFGKHFANSERKSIKKTRYHNATVRAAEVHGLPGQVIHFDATYRRAEVRVLPKDPLGLLLRYKLLSLVERWAAWTNETPSTQMRPRQKHSRSYKWRPTSPEEIYLFFDMLIYMGIHREAQLPNCMPKVYRHVNGWSVHIKETGDSFYSPGSDLTVDEAMVRFTGRSMETTIVPTKPIPTNFKICILAQARYCLRWLWHVQVPQSAPAPTDDAGKQAAPTPTQRVFTTLLFLLPAAIYHVFLNLFASVKLFRALRGHNIEATGTCRRDKVNQFTWKDNALVLFLATVFRETSEIVRRRRRPAGDSAAKRVARQVFGADVRKDLPARTAVDQ